MTSGEQWRGIPPHEIYSLPEMLPMKQHFACPYCGYDLMGLRGQHHNTTCVKQSGRMPLPAALRGLAPGGGTVSIEVELNGKAGRVCKQAQAGEIHCGLIVRPTSEDLVVGNVFGLLKHVRPHLWLGPMLNLALETDRFRQVWYKRLSIRFWERQAKFPPELLDFREGRTETDIVIEWENPPTTVWIEAKWGSRMATRTANCETNDQVIRGVRTLLAETGHIRPARLFDKPVRQPIWIALQTYKPEPKVDALRDPEALLQALAQAEQCVTLPRMPFLGTITWGDIPRVMARNGRALTGCEKQIAADVARYLSAKSSCENCAAETMDVRQDRPAERALLTV